MKRTAKTPSDSWVESYPPLSQDQLAELRAARLILGVKLDGKTLYLRQSIERLLQTCSDLTVS